MLRNQDVEVNIEVEEQKIFISLSRDVFHIAGTQSSFINIKLFQKLYIFLSVVQGLSLAVHIPIYIISF